MYKFSKYIFLFIIITLITPNLVSSTEPLSVLSLHPGQNKISMSVVNKGIIDLCSVSVILEKETTPAWLSLRTSGDVDVPAYNLSDLELFVDVSEVSPVNSLVLPLVLRDKTGSTWRFEVFLKIEANLPSRYELSQNYPNPFNPTTTIRYSLPKTEAVPTRLEVFNSLGQLVRTLVDKPQTGGIYNVVWNGLDQRGKEVSGGTYFCRLSSGDYTKTIKMSLVK